MSRQRQFSGCIRACKVNEAGGKIGELFSLGNLNTLELEIQKELIKDISNLCDSAGNTLSSRAKPAEAGGTLSCREWMPDVVLEALGATKSNQTISATTLTDEDITLVGFGYWAEIGTKRLDNVVVKDSAGMNTLVKGTDYLIDEYTGIIQPIEGSTHFTTGTEHVLVSADGQADTTPIYTIGAGAMGTYRLTGKVKDSWSGLEGEILLRKVRLVLSSPVALVGSRDDELTPLEFELSPEVVEGQDGFGTFAGAVLA